MSKHIYAVIKIAGFNYAFVRCVQLPLIKILCKIELFNKSLVTHIWTGLLEVVMVYKFAIEGMSKTALEKKQVMQSMNIKRLAVLSDIDAKLTSKNIPGDLRQDLIEARGRLDGIVAQIESNLDYSPTSSVMGFYDGMQKMVKVEKFINDLNSEFEELAAVVGYKTTAELKAEQLALEQSAASSKLRTALRRASVIPPKEEGQQQTVAHKEPGGLLTSFANDKAEKTKSGPPTPASPASAAPSAASTPKPAASSPPPTTPKTPKA